MNRIIETMGVIHFERVDANACIPTKSSKGSAGFDLYSLKEVVVPAKQRAVIDTGVVVTLPHGCYGQIFARSKLSSKYDIDVGAGVIDSDYTGTLKVILINSGNYSFHLNRGAKCAQLVPIKIEYPIVYEIKHDEGGDMYKMLVKENCDERFDRGGVNEFLKEVESKDASMHEAGCEDKCDVDDVCDEGDENEDYDFLYL